MALRKSLLYFFLLFCASSMSAQLQVGLKGGYTLAWVFYNDELPENAEITINSFHLSGMAYLPLGEHLSLGVEPGWVQRGAACIPRWQPIWAGDSKVFLNYLEAPVMLRFHQPLWQNRMEVFAKMGYGLSMLVKGKTQLVSELIDPFPDTTPVSIGRTGEFRRWDHGGYVGLGAGFKVGPGKVLLESSFYLGLRNANRLTISQNRSLNCSIGYSIGL